MPRNTIKSIRLYRGTTQQHSDYAGPDGEITVDTEKYTVVVQNGVTGGVPLARESDVTAEAQAREAADTAIQKKVTDEASARMAADTTLQHNLTNEASASDAADITLRNNLTNEIHVREAADTALQKSITDEASARETADNALQEQIDNTLRRGAVIGEIRWFAMSTPPEGWLVCNGASVLISDYPALYNAIGNTFLPEDVPASPAMFELPNLIGKVPWGYTSVGTVIEAGLPNIEGNILLEMPGGGSLISGAGYRALYNNYSAKSTSGFAMDGSSVTRSKDNFIRFDASRSNPIYGRSDTVQPPALCLLPCIRYE